MAGQHTIELHRIRDKLVKTYAGFEERGLKEKVEAVLSVIDSATETESKSAHLQKSIQWLQYTIVAVVFLLVVFIFRAAFWPSTDLVVPLTLPMQFSDILQSIDTFSSLVIGLVLGLFFLTKILEKKQSELVLEKLSIIHESIHLFDLIHIGKEPINLSSDDPSGSHIDEHERRKIARKYLISLQEAALLSGKVGTVFGRYSNDPAVVEKIESIETLSHNTSFSIWRKIEILHKND